MKRYVLTFKDRHIRGSEVAALLRLPVESVVDAERALRASPESGKRRAMSFEGLGAVAIDLDEREVCELCRRDDIVEVIEDTDVRTLKSAAYQASRPSPRWGEGADAADVPAGTLPAVDAGNGSTQLSAQTSAHVSAQVSAQTSAQTRPPGPIPWNIEIVGAHLVWDRCTGADVRVALLDTGIDDNHPDVPVAGGISYVPAVRSWVDDNGHGTHCAGIIGARNLPTGSVGVAPACELYAVKVLSSDGSGCLSSILAGMLWSAQNRMHVVSISVGSKAAAHDPGFVVYQRAAERCIAAGAIVLAAAGNTGCTSEPWLHQPARCPNVVAVGAINRRAELTRFSCRGPTQGSADCDIEIVAPGAGIHSTVPGGRYRHMSGTSMACSHVAGAAALLKERHPRLTPIQLRAQLRSTGAAVRRPGGDQRRSHAMLDCRLLLLPVGEKVGMRDSAPSPRRGEGGDEGL